MLLLLIELLKKDAVRRRYGIVRVQHHEFNPSRVCSHRCRVGDRFGSARTPKGFTGRSREDAEWRDPRYRTRLAGWRGSGSRSYRLSVIRGARSARAGSSPAWSMRRWRRPLLPRAGSRSGCQPSRSRLASSRRWGPALSSPRGASSAGAVPSASSRASSRMRRVVSSCTPPRPSRSCGAAPEGARTPPRRSLSEEVGASGWSDRGKNVGDGVVDYDPALGYDGFYMLRSPKAPLLRVHQIRE